ncbi:hypothetical protein [Microbacterium aureliae]
MVDLQCVDVSEQRVAVGNGVSVPASWTAVMRGEPDVPGEIQVHAVYSPELRRVVAGEVRVTRGDEKDEVTSVTLREVRVQYALQASGLRVSTVAEPGERDVSGGEYILRMRERGERTNEQTMADAVRLYQLAYTINLPPLRMVSDNLGVSQSTATRLMSRVRGDDRRPQRRHAPGPYTGPAGPSSGGPSIF